MQRHPAIVFGIKPHVAFVDQNLAQHRIGLHIVVHVIVAVVPGAAFLGCRQAGIARQVFDLFAVEAHLHQLVNALLDAVRDECRIVDCPRVLADQKLFRRHVNDGDAASLRRPAATHIMGRAGHHALDKRVVVFLDIDLQLDRLLGVFENFEIGIRGDQRILCVGQILVHLHVVFFDSLVQVLNYADLLD